ncbi:MAG: tyrosine-type recombinase/integrase [Gammaproteobacteria bacterium]
MTSSTSFAVLLERFFVERLRQQRHASNHTIASYRDTFRLLLDFAQRTLHRAPCQLDLTDLNADLIGAFLNGVERQRNNSARTRNLRLTAIRSFCQFACLHEPEQCAHFQRILAIPLKRHVHREIDFLSRSEIEAILAAPSRSSWIGRRDHALLLLAVQTGLRLSELTSLRRDALILGAGAYVRCIGKGRKERCTPLTKQTVAVLKAWLKELSPKDTGVIFPSTHGAPLSADAVQYLLHKYANQARKICASLRNKRISPHVLRHSAAMELLHAGVDSTLIALWLGHESVETTQVYIHAHLALKEAALAKAVPLQGRPSRFKPADRVMQFLSTL